MPTPVDPAPHSGSASSAPNGWSAIRFAGWVGWLLVAMAVLLAGAWLLFRHWFWPGIDQWRPRIEAMLSVALDAPVSIGELSSGFEGLRPSLRASRIRVGSVDDAPLAIDQASAIVSLLSLVRGDPGLLSLEVERPVIRVERIEQRRFSVAGALLDLDRPGSSAPLSWVLASRSITVRNARIDWRDRMGSEPVVVAGIDISSSGGGGRHHVSLRAPAVGAGLQGLDLAVDFVARTPADLADWRQWQGEAYASAMQIDFVPLARTLRGWLSPGNASSQVVLGGSGPLKAWARFEGGRIDDVLVKAFTESIEVRAGSGRLGLRSLSLEVQARMENARTLTIVPRRLSAVDAAGFAFALDEQAEQRVTFDLGTLQPVSGRLAWRGFDAGRLLEAMRRLPLPDPWPSRLAQLGVSGRVGGAAFNWDQSGERYAVTLGFERLSLSLRRVERRGARPERWPSFANLTGVAEFNDRNGQVRLDSSGASLRLPGTLAEPSMALGSVSGILGWELGAVDEAGVEAAVELHAAGLSVANADFAGSFSGRWRSSGQSGLGEIDLAGSLTRASANRVAAYLPVSVPASVRAWLAAAVSASGASETRFRVRGDLADFPFRDPGQGEFRVETRLDQARLAFAPDWPPIDRIRGALVFQGASMDLKAESAEVTGVPLSHIHARIADFARPVLAIDGRAGGALQTMLRFVEASPLRAGLDPEIRQWRIDGMADLALRLGIGLGPGGRTDYHGTLRLSDNQLQLAPNLPSITAIEGEVGFDRSGVRGKALTARLLGGPVQANIDSRPGENLRLDAHGTVAAAEVATILGPGASNLIQGSADWQATLDAGSQTVRASLGSTLLAVATALPEPFAKQAGSRWPLRLDWAMSRSPVRAETLRVALRDDVRMLLERRADASRPRAVIAIGTDAPLPTEGISLALSLPRLDLDAWERAFDPPALPAAASAVAIAMPVPPLSPTAERLPGGAAARAQDGSLAGLSSQVDRITLIADSLVAGGKDLTQVVMGASRLDGRWRASISSREVDGHLEWQPVRAGLTAGALQGRFALLRVPRNRQSEIERMLDAAPARLPALDIEADRLVLFGRELGRLSLRASNAADGEHPAWRLERLRIDHPGGTLDARGVWEASGVNAARATSLDFELGLREPARLLETFGVSGAINGGGPGRLGGRVRWTGSPLAIDYRSLAGDLDVKLGKGQFLKTDPGISKLIGVLNLQSLPRRLNLDFRDVFAEGFAFDEIQGKASIASGIATTSDFRMRGVQAQVAIRGDVNLAEETQALRVEVRPEFNAGIASLAYAAVANPAIGLGSFLAQWALRKPLQDMLSYEYDVAGSWADPNVVERARPRFDAQPAQAPR